MTEPSGADLLINEEWGKAIPPIDAAFTQVIDVVAVAFETLKGMPTLLARWSQMRGAFDSFLQVRRGGGLDSYYRIVKESQLAAKLIMNPNASRQELFDMCIGVQASRPATVADLQTRDVKAKQLDQAVTDKTAFGEAPQGN